jgi:uracil-DNA glycosylase family 4
MGVDGGRARALKQRLESLAAAGVSSLPKAGCHRVSPVTEARVPVDDRSRSRALEVLRDQVSACTRCAELAGGRTQTVFGGGPPPPVWGAAPPAPRLCFFGEAPGADEDASGIPFVGRAGQLLTKIIEACTLSRDEVYILNVLKCRPPNNRPPRPDEVANCRGYFEEQLRLIRPEFICCLGTSAAQALLQTAEPIGKLRGRWFAHGSAAVLCTYHPSYLLRNPAAKREVWEDMKILMERMGVRL